MLCLNHKVGDVTYLTLNKPLPAGTRIAIHVLGPQPGHAPRLNHARLGFDAPHAVNIVRGKVLERDEQTEKAARGEIDGNK